MHNQVNQATNVVSLFDSKDKSGKDGSVEASAEFQNVCGGSFLDIMEKNRQNKERMAKERANANKSVLRTYRIKN